MAASSRIFCLNLGMQTIGMAEFRAGSNDGLVLENFRLTEILADPAAESSRLAQIRIALNEMREHLKVKTAKASYAIPAQAVFTRFVKLPTVGEEKVEQIIQFEAQQNVPFPIDEVVWDYQLVSAAGSDQLEVVLVAIKAEMLDELNQAVQDSGCETSTVDVAPMALYNAFRYNYSDVPGCSLLIDVGARTTNLVFVEPGKVFSRSIPIGGTSVTQAIAKEFDEPFGAAEERKRKHGLVGLGGSYAEHEDPEVARLSKIIRNSMAKLHAEVARSISFYRSQQQGAPPLRAYLCGGAVSLPYAREFFAEKLNLPIEFFNPLRNVAVAPGVNMDDAGRSAHVLGELVGLGLRAVSDCPMELNLQPASVIRAHAMARRTPYLIMAGICLLLLLTGFWLYYDRAARTYQQAVAKIEPEIAQLSQVEEQFKRVGDEKKQAIRKVEPLLKAVADKDFWTGLLDDVNGRIPQNDIWITEWVPGYVAVDKNDRTGLSDKFMPFRVGQEAGATYLPEGLNRREATQQSPPGRANQAAPEPPVFGLRLQGLYLENPKGTGVVDDFARALEASPYVGQGGVVVLKRQQNNGETWAFDWELLVKLKQGISTP